MNAKDQSKLLNAGFIIIRKEVLHIVSHDFSRKIKAKTPEKREWHTLEDKFESTASLERRMKQLLKNQMTVED